MTRLTDRPTWWAGRPTGEDIISITLSGGACGFIVLIGLTT
jgi:hypothetical protein